jgi:hypothetical protein
MAEWSVTGTERDVLLAAKLYLPGPRPGQVSRPRLLARLDEGLAQGWSWSVPRPGTARRSCWRTGPLGKLIAAQRTGHVAAGIPIGYLAGSGVPSTPGRPRLIPACPASSIR